MSSESQEPSDQCECLGWARVDCLGGGGLHHPDCPKASKPKRFFKLSPELVDGDHWSPVESKSDVLQAVADWIDEHGPEVGESFSVEVVSMTQEEVDELPEL